LFLSTLLALANPVIQLGGKLQGRITKFLCDTFMQNSKVEPLFLVRCASALEEACEKAPVSLDLQRDFFKALAGPWIAANKGSFEAAVVSRHLVGTLILCLRHRSEKVLKIAQHLRSTTLHELGIVDSTEMVRLLVDCGQDPPDSSRKEWTPAPDGHDAAMAFATPANVADSEERVKSYQRDLVRLFVFRGCAHMASKLICRFRLDKEPEFRSLLIPEQFDTKLRTESVGHVDSPPNDRLNIEDLGCEVLLVHDSQSLRQARRLLLPDSGEGRPKALGLDAEWKPFARGMPPNPVALLQVATESHAFLFDLVSLETVGGVVPAEHALHEASASSGDMEEVQILPSGAIHGWLEMKQGGALEDVVWLRRYFSCGDASSVRMLHLHNSEAEWRRRSQSSQKKNRIRVTSAQVLGTGSSGSPSTNSGDQREFIASSSGASLEWHLRAPSISAAIKWVANLNNSPVRGAAQAEELSSPASELRNEFRSLIEGILLDGSISKFGFAFAEDLRRLRESYPNWTSLPAELGSFTELHEQGRRGGLSSLVAEVTGKHLDKSMQTSNWETRPLSHEQIRYAALDARCLLELA